MNIALCLSGGIGTRLGGDIPKQYIRVGDRMVISYCLETLLRSEWIDFVVIVAEESWRERISEDIGAEQEEPGIYRAFGKMLCFADPGANRQLSILNGMERTVQYIEVNNRNNVQQTELDQRQKNVLAEQWIVSAQTEVRNADREAMHTVFIHDAARPMLTEDLIDACFRALPGHDGVMPVLPMKDTVYYSEDGKGITQLLQREKIFAGQAPELFLFHKYLEATKALLPDRIMEIKGSGEPAIMHGMDIVMIPGDEGNFKITTAADLTRFREIAEKSAVAEGD